jgi:hypothetical protein
LEDTAVEGRIILKLTFKKWDGERGWTGIIWLKGTGGRML